MALKIWIDGELREKDAANISVYDHGVLYGDGVFEGIRSYNGRIFECDAHVRRLWDSAKAIRLTIPMTPEAFVAAMEQTIKANNMPDCYIRAVVTRGPGDLGIDPRKATRGPVVYIIADKIAIYPADMYEKGISVISSSWIRNHSASTPPRIKSLNYLNNVLAKIEASDAGANDALMLNHNGHVAELTAANVFIVRDNKLATPRLADGILEGVTRRVFMQMAGKMGIECVERSLDRFDVYSADEMFATGTGVEAIPITKVDGRVIGSGVAGPISQKLLSAFRKHVREG
jgi:branched-chain amino acid aminotransferase